MSNTEKLISILGLVIVAILMRAFVLMKIWEWLIVPIFEVTPLNMTEAFAFGLFVSYFQPSPKLEGTDDKLGSAFVKILAGSFVMLSFAYLTHLML